jgi:hypothetical protein
MEQLEMEQIRKLLEEKKLFLIERDDYIDYMIRKIGLLKELLIIFVFISLIIIYKIR